MTNGMLKMDLLEKVCVHKRARVDLLYTCARVCTHYYDDNL